MLAMSSDQPPNRGSSVGERRKEDPTHGMKEGRAGRNRIACTYAFHSGRVGAGQSILPNGLVRIRGQCSDRRQAPKSFEARLQSNQFQNNVP
jgi:Flp pilus assembly protein TadD